MKLKRILKIIGGLVIFFTLPSLLFFGFVYFKYNEDLPSGETGAKADALAHKMLDALNHEAYEVTNYLEWQFKNRRLYKWYKTDNRCQVHWNNYKVDLNLNDLSQSKVYVNDFQIDDEQSEALITKAHDYFNTDSFWLVAPYKVFDKGVKRQVINYNGKEALLVTLTSGDSYLWILDDTAKPIGYKMWVSVLPIGGIEASWKDWITTESGAQLPTVHYLPFMKLDMGKVVGTK